MAQIEYIRGKNKWRVQRDNGNNSREFVDYDAAQEYCDYLQSLDNQDTLVRQHDEIISLLKPQSDTRTHDDDDDYETEAERRERNKREAAQRAKELAKWKRSKLPKLEQQLINDPDKYKNQKDFWTVAMYTKKLEVLEILSTSKNPYVLDAITQNNNTPEYIKDRVSRRYAFYKWREEEIKENGKVGWIAGIIFRWGIVLFVAAIVIGFLYLIFH